MSVDAIRSPAGARRRRLIVEAASLTACLGLWPLGARASPVKMALGLELITILPLLTTNLRSTLSAVANIGYREVETLGTLGKSAATVASALDDCGLRSSSQHLVPDDLFEVFQQWDGGALTLPQALSALRRGYNLQDIDRIVCQGIARAHAMRQQFLVWPVLFDEHVSSRRSLDALIEALNRAGTLCRREGLTFAFHNGSKAFERIGPELVYDIILQSTDPKTVKMELDTYYAAKAGVDASAYLRKYPGRFRLIHLKDMDSQGNITDLGQGMIDFPAILRAATATGVKHFFVEHDRAKDPLGSARACFNYVEETV